MRYYRKEWKMLTKGRSQFAAKTDKYNTISRKFGAKPVPVKKLPVWPKSCRFYIFNSLNRNFYPFLMKKGAKERKSTPLQNW